jgi:hypothetical protein
MFQFDNIIEKSVKLLTTFLLTRLKMHLNSSSQPKKYEQCQQPQNDGSTEHSYLIPNQVTARSGLLQSNRIRFSLNILKFQLTRAAPSRRISPLCMTPEVTHPQKLHMLMKPIYVSEA